MGHGLAGGGILLGRVRGVAYPESLGKSEGIFWYNEACWVTARAAYSPLLVAEFTLNHLKRNQLAMNLGMSETGVTTPTATWNPNRVLWYAGGVYAFDGTTTACDGTFCFDFTDLLTASPGLRRFYVGMRDSTVGDVATLKAYRLLDMVRNRTISCAAVPQLADGSQVYAWVDYDFDSGTLPPVAAASASLTVGTIPLTVAFDGSASYDPDGTIVSYSWDFGDGTSGTGMTCEHTYTHAGTFNARLTVIDNDGVEGTDSVVVEAIDPNVIAAPSGLTATLSGKTVTLRWKDNSNNETGFHIERAPKTGKSRSFVRVGSVGANFTTYSETVASGQYAYRVQAFNSTTGVSSGYSNTASVKVR